MKVFFCSSLALLLICAPEFTESRGIRKKKLLEQVNDYEASGDYFEVTVNNYKQENFRETMTTKKPLPEDVPSDDGVTCSQSNITDVLSGFLNLATRFFNMRLIFHDHKFIVLTSDHSSDTVMDFIEKEEFPADIVVIDEDEFLDFGFVVDLEELHVYVVDQCSKLAYIVVPPWSSAQHPYVKAAIISTIIDLPCGCPSEEFASNVFDGTTGIENQTENVDSRDESTPQQFTDETTTETLSNTNIPVIDIETDEIENIEDLLDNVNSLNQSPNDSVEMELPLRIIIPSMHMHFDSKSKSYWKYDQFVLKTDNKSYHSHLRGGEKLIEIDSDFVDLQNMTRMDSKIFVGNRSLQDIRAVAQVDKIFIDRLGKSYKIQKEFLGIENVFEISPVDFDIIKVTPAHQVYGVRHHYEQLNQWLMFKV